jgi:hypothetical protein
VSLELKVSDQTRKKDRFGDAEEERDKGHTEDDINS